MRTWKFSSWAWGYYLCFLASAVSLVLFFGAFTQSKFQGGLDATVNTFQQSNSLRVLSKGKGYPPVLAYWICGTKGEGKRILRLLKAIYHPRNRYLLQLDGSASDHERMDLLFSIQSEQVFQVFHNVDVVGKSYALNKMGSSALSAVLHAAALLLKISDEWDWFVTLSPSDYPLMTQDDILHALTFLPRDLNLIHYSNKTAEDVHLKLNQIVVDPSLYYDRSTPLMFAVESREPPDAFTIYRGWPWVILTRRFMEYCVIGWDNLPRKLLMFFSNVVNPLESYFHTVLSNSPEFQNTSIDNVLRYSSLYPNLVPSASRGLQLDMLHYESMVASGAAFAGPFQADHIVLQKLDESILKRPPDEVTPGEWCKGKGMKETTMDSSSQQIFCSNWDSDSRNIIDAVQAGPSGIRLKHVLYTFVGLRQD